MITEEAMLSARESALDGKVPELICLNLAHLSSLLGDKFTEGRLIQVSRVDQMILILA